jgi:DNA repair protein RecO (recombination protein O)
MPPTSSPAVILHAFKYGETSKIVRLATPGHGVVSAIAKGAMRPKSPFGARLQVLTRGTALLYLKPNRELQTLAGFEVASQWPPLSHDLGRFAVATVLAELVLRCSPAEPQPAVYHVLATGLERVAGARAAALCPVSLACVWRLVAALGFAPALDRCARDGRPVAPGPAAFSVAHGGLVCQRCAGAGRRRLPAEDRRMLQRFVAGDDAFDQPVTPVTPSRALAHRRLLARFIRHHLAEGRTLRALDFWEAQPWITTS